VTETRRSISRSRTQARTRDSSAGGRSKSLPSKRAKGRRYRRRPWVSKGQTVTLRLTRRSTRPPLSLRCNEVLCTHSRTRERARSPPRFDPAASINRNPRTQTPAELQIASNKPQREDSRRESRRPGCATPCSLFEAAASCTARRLASAPLLRVAQLRQY